MHPGFGLHVPRTIVTEKPVGGGGVGGAFGHYLGNFISLRKNLILEKTDAVFALYGRVASPAAHGVDRQPLHFPRLPARR